MRKEIVFIFSVVVFFNFTSNIFAQNSGQGFSINSSQLVSTLSIEAGEDITLTSPVVGSTYQWMLNGHNISGATNESYNIKYSKYTDEGTYTVEVNGKDTKRALTLNVENSLIEVIKEDIWQISSHSKYYGPLNEKKVENPVVISYNGNILQIKSKEQTKS